MVKPAIATGYKIHWQLAIALVLGLSSRMLSATSTPAQTYAAYCADCHGANLEGARAPALLNPRWMQEGGDRELLSLTRDGVPNRGMPAWGGVLSADDLGALVDFIRTRTSEQSAAPTPTAENGSQIVKTDQYALRIEPVLEHGLDQSRSLAVLSDGVLLISDSKGLRVFRNGGLVPEPVAGLPPLDALEEIAPHRAGDPGKPGEEWLYITYVCSSTCGHADRHAYSLARGHLREGRWTDHQVLLRFGDGDHVYGVSKLAFDDKGYAYFTLSGADHPGQDPADFEAELGKAQNLASHRGKIFRVHDDGRVPRDNPFIDEPGALPIVWSYGHRGLSGLSFDNSSRALWATEHGPWGGDELNRVVRGGNYGWPLVSFGYHYAGKPIRASQAPGLEPPVFHWTPSVGISTVQVYDGAAFPKWRGSVLVGSLGARIGRTLYRFELNDNRALLYKYPSDAQGRVLRDEKGNAQPRVPRYEEIAPDIGRIRDLRIGPEGHIYLLLEHPDRVVRLVPAPWNVAKNSRQERR